MKRRIKQIHIIAIFTICASLLAIGCTPAKRPVPINDYNQDRTKTQMYDNKTLPREKDYNLNGTRDINNNVFPDTYEEKDLGYDNTLNNTGNNLTLEREIEKIAGIRNAVVIVDNNTAYVGIEKDTTSNMDRKAIQTKVANKIKDKMPNIAKVSVTTETDRVKKLRGYTRDITNGKTVRDFIDQIQDLF